MRQPCSALQWWFCAQGGRGSTWWWSRWPNSTSWVPKTTTIWPSDDNNNLSVTLPAPCGRDIREKLLLCFAGVYSLSNRLSPVRSLDAIFCGERSLCLWIYSCLPHLFVCFFLSLEIQYGHRIEKTKWKDMEDSFKGPLHQFYTWKSGHEEF